MKRYMKLSKIYRFFILRDYEGGEQRYYVHRPRLHNILYALTNIIDAEGPNYSLVLLLELRCEISDLRQTCLLEDQSAVVSERTLEFIAVGRGSRIHAVDGSVIIHGARAHAHCGLKKIRY